MDVRCECIHGIDVYRRHLAEKNVTMYTSLLVGKPDVTWVVFGPVFYLKYKICCVGI